MVRDHHSFASRNKAILYSYNNTFKKLQKVNSDACQGKSHSDHLNSTIWIHKIIAAALQRQNINFIVASKFPEVEFQCLEYCFKLNKTTLLHTPLLYDFKAPIKFRRLHQGSFLIKFSICNEIPCVDCKEFQLYIAYTRKYNIYTNPENYLKIFQVY